ncbi:MAG: hypothetical protein ACLQVL_35475 [Terriglobia bacterium]
MSTLFQDPNYGLRMLTEDPGFTAAGVVMPAVGTGLNTEPFFVASGLWLNPLRYWQHDGLVGLSGGAAEFSKLSISHPNFLDFVRENGSFSALAGFQADDFDLTGRGEPERVPVEMISVSFFPLLGVKPIIDRRLLPGENQVRVVPVALIGGGLWTRTVGGFARSGDPVDPRSAGSISASRAAGYESRSHGGVKI